MCGIENKTASSARTQIFYAFGINAFEFNVKLSNPPYNAIIVLPAFSKK